MTLVAPLSIECGNLSINAESLDVKASSGKTDSVVFLRSEQFQALRPPALFVREPGSFFVSWPGARAHPWTSFATEVCESDSTDITDALRRLRRFLTAFRARGQKQLGRFKGKIESDRMTKGTGHAVLAALLREGILTVDDKWYILDTEALGEKLGVSYVDCQAHRFGDLAINFVRRAVESD